MGREVQFERVKLKEIHNISEAGKKYVMISLALLNGVCPRNIYITTFYNIHNCNGNARWYGRVELLQKC